MPQGGEKNGNLRFYQTVRKQKMYLCREIEKFVGTPFCSQAVCHTSIVGTPGLLWPREGSKFLRKEQRTNSA